jgi:diaminopropionate ammonia-lyase
MLSCGLASAPAVKILREHDARSVVVGEAMLQHAAMELQNLAQCQDITRSRDVAVLRTSRAGLHTTPSGATGLAGLLHVSSNDELRELHQLDEESCVLLVVTEGALASTATIFGTS